MMQVDFLQILQAIKSGSNPQQLVMQILEGQMGSTPMGQNLLNLIKNNKVNEIETIARNICQQKGINFDKEFPAFKQMFIK